MGGHTHTHTGCAVTRLASRPQKDCRSNTVPHLVLLSGSPQHASVLAASEQTCLMCIVFRFQLRGDGQV